MLLTYYATKLVIVCVKRSILKHFWRPLPKVKCFTRQTRSCNCSRSLSGLRDERRRQRHPAEWRSETEDRHRQGAGPEPENPASGWGNVSSGYREREGKISSFIINEFSTQNGVASWKRWNISKRHLQIEIFLLQHWDISLTTLKYFAHNIQIFRLQHGQHTDISLTTWTTYRYFAYNMDNMEIFRLQHWDSSLTTLRYLWQCPL